MPQRNSEKAEPVSRALCALLTEDCAERLELARAQGVLRVRLQNGTDTLASMHNCKRLEGLTFRADLSTSGSERLELIRA